jgi:hypothetical protein
MSANLKLLSIEDLEMLLCIQREKVAREAEVKRLAEEVAQEAEQAVAEAAKKAEEEALLQQDPCVFCLLEQIDQPLDMIASLTPIQVCVCNCKCV